MVRRTLWVAFASDREGAGGSNISGHDRGRTFRCPNWSVTLLYFVVICLLGCRSSMRAVGHSYHTYLPACAERWRAFVGSKEAG